MKNNNLLDIYDLNEFIAIDLETTGLDSQKESVIEISAVKFKNGVQDSTFSYLLNPEKIISPFIEDLTGITNKMVSDKPLFNDIIDEFISFISDLPIVGHNVGFDIKFIKVQSKNEVDLEETHQICDTYFLSKAILFSNTQFSLEALSDYYGLSTSGSHRATNDAINSGLIFLKFLEQLILFDTVILERLNTLFKDRTVFNRDVICNAYKYSASLADNQKKDTNHFNESIISYKSKDKDIALNLDNIISDDGVLYNNNNIYKYRDAQYKMSKAIEDDISNQNISIIEAGTGLGKTYAYLIPFIIEAKEKNLPLIVSTYTKNLQEQLFYKDIKNIIELLDIDQIAIILKGRGNYVCLNRLDVLENNSNELITNFECHDLAAVITWSNFTKSGDIDECGSFSMERNSRLWSLLKSDVKFCSKNCFSSSQCFYAILVNSIDRANLIVVNHSVFALDAIEKRNLLPQENYFVIDEAHDFFKATKKILTSEFDKIFFNNYLNDISNLIKSLNTNNKEINHFFDMINLAKEQVNSFFDSYLVIKNSNNYESSNYPSIKSFKDIEIEFQDCNPTLINLANDLETIANKVDIIDDAHTDFLLIKNSGLLDMLIQFSDAIRNFLKCIKSDEHISWVKYHEQSNYVSINYLLKDMGKVIGTNCFGNSNIGIFCSATISIDNNFEYFKTSLGLDRLSYDRDFSEHIFQAPFFLEEQVSFYSYKSDLHINSDDYIFNISEQIFELASFFNKKMLVLCTSYKQASQLKHRLFSKFKDINKQLLVHEKGRSRNSLIRAFKESKNSVLIGTMAFLEGVDFPGDELSILMMIRIPFSNPNDPYLKYLDNQLNIQGKNGFNEYQVPEACIKMKQGFGRLIRTELDSGIFIITDPRIFSSSYGRTIINSFPLESTLYTDISKILTDNKIL